MLSRHLKEHEKCQQLQQTQFSSMDLSLKQIKVLDKIRPKYKFISELYLDHNQLITLNGIQQFQNLQIFSFNFNHVQSANELHKIKNKFFLKSISYIGNPLQYRADEQFLRDSGFVALIKVNQLQARTINVPKYRNRNKYIKNIIEQNQQPTDSHTQRYPQKYPDQSPHHPNFHHLKTDYTHTQSHKYLTNTQPRPQGSQKWKTNRSTTLNKSNQIFRNQQCLKNGSKEQGYSGSEEGNVDIRPFRGVEEDHRGHVEQDRKYNDREENDRDGDGHSSDIQQQSQIKKQQNQDQISESGHFNNESSYQNSFKRSQPSIKINSFAIQFLQQQKCQISQAFRRRYIKQKIFFYLLKNKNQNHIPNISQKRKAWAAIKIFNTLQSKV